ncbi:MAG: hypothetical protein AB7U76_25965 [Pirellulales bacterium]
MRAIPGLIALLAAGIACANPPPTSPLGGIRDAEWQHARGVTPVAGQDDANSKIDLGKQHAEGRGVPKDIEQARRLFLDAAQQGHPEAPFLLAATYVFMVEPPQFAEGCGWLSIAQEQRFDDHAFAAHLLEDLRAGMSPQQLDECEAFARRNRARLEERTK